MISCKHSTTAVSSPIKSSKLLMIKVSFVRQTMQKQGHFNKNIPIPRSPREYNHFAHTATDVRNRSLSYYLLFTSYRFRTSCETVNNNWSVIYVMSEQPVFVCPYSYSLGERSVLSYNA